MFGHGQEDRVQPFGTRAGERFPNASDDRQGFGVTAPACPAAATGRRRGGLVEAADSVFAVVATDSLDPIEDAGAFPAARGRPVALAHLRQVLAASGHRHGHGTSLR